ncbi:MAG: hypothetical protein ACR2RF_10430 [Geminicoccaceae bacterium]
MALPFDINQLMRDSWEDFVQRANQAPPPDQGTATDQLQILAPDMTDAEGDALLNAVAVIYNNLGINSQDTYIALRNEINQAGETASMGVFDVIVGPISQLAESTPWQMSLSKKSMEDEVTTTIDADITTIETEKAAQTDPVIIGALDEGVAAKSRRKEELTARLANRGVVV